jgi:gas vesicle protein
MLLAPASGKDLRKRLTWMSEQQWKTFSHTAERFLNDVTVSAAAELARAKSYCAAKAA